MHPFAHSGGPTNFYLLQAPSQRPGHGLIDFPVNLSAALLPGAIRNRLRIVGRHSIEPINGRFPYFVAPMVPGTITPEVWRARTSGMTVTDGGGIVRYDGSRTVAAVDAEGSGRHSIEPFTAGASHRRRNHAGMVC
jgi:hypothetical protein